MTSWPTRDSICLDCRSTVCAQPKHRRVGLRDGAGRELLLETVWGPASVRRRIRESMAVSAAATGPSSCVPDCGPVDLFDGFWPIVIVIGLFLAIAALWFGARTFIEWRRKRRAMRIAKGAWTKGPTVGTSTGCYGRILRGPRALEPVAASGECVAFAVELSYLGRRHMLRDGATIGFDVELETGERLRVPAGPCVIDLADAERIDPGRIEHYLQELDPRRVHANDLDPFPRDRVSLVALSPGDRIEILGPLRTVVDGGATAASYRDSAPALLVPDGIPRLRPCR